MTLMTLRGKARLIDRIAIQAWSAGALSMGGILMILGDVMGHGVTWHTLIWGLVFGAGMICGTCTYSTQQQLLARLKE
jgi:hypothetical protein